MKRFLSVHLIVLLFAACGSDGDKSQNNIVINNASNNINNTMNNGTTQAPADAREQSIVDGFNAPQDTNDAGEAGLTLAVESVVQASIAANGGVELVTTGTLTQSGQQFSYSATPADRLVIDWTEGPSTEVFVTQIDGDFEAETVEDFFGSNHAVSVRIVREGFADFEVGSVKEGGTVESAIIGDITDGDTTYTVNLQKTGTTVSEVGTTIDYTSDSTMSGTISAPGLELIAEETFYYRHVFVDTNVVNRTRTANSRWTYNGSEYGVNEVVIRTATADGWPDEFDFWRAEGTITEDGVVVGEIRAEQNEVAVDILLALESGRKVVLDSYLLYQE